MNRLLYVGRFLWFALLLVAAWMPAALRSVPHTAQSPAARVEAPAAPAAPEPVPVAEPEPPVPTGRELGIA